MLPYFFQSSVDEYSFYKSRNYHPRKRRRLIKTEGEGHSFESSSSPFHLEDLFTVLEQGELDDERPFEDVMEPHLNDLIRVRREHDNKLSEVDETVSQLLEWALIVAQSFFVGMSLEAGAAFRRFPIQTAPRNGYYHGAKYLITEGQNLARELHCLYTFTHILTPFIIIYD